MRELAGELMEAFTSGQFDEINLVYTEFVSVVTQRPVVKRLLPVEELSGSSDGEEAARRIHLRAEPRKRDQHLAASLCRNGSVCGADGGQGQRDGRAG